MDHSLCMDEIVRLKVEDIQCIYTTSHVSLLHYDGVGIGMMCSMNLKVLVNLRLRAANSSPSSLGRYYE